MYPLAQYFIEDGKEIQACFTSRRRGRSRESKEAHEARRVARRQEDARAWVRRAQKGDFSDPPKDMNGLRYIQSHHTELWIHMKTDSTPLEDLIPTEAQSVRMKRQPNPSRLRTNEEG